ncbi:acyltransferase [Bifidobacterium sp. ESL0704]|uniref:acyltransferase family protein n=1 Tax=Bifidobacterium sp. ESL0704 TaxID=2983219 RepID=UPI0023F900E6|nr:acyltransferase [Bifidobacterium sp. ESL0704]WEV52725.1 acyltransferase [Bifidobacterium sp. ESL0704]
MRSLMINTGKTKTPTNHQNSSNLRDSRIESLRIIAMFLIVLCHFTIHINWKLLELPGIRGAVAHLLVDGGQVGVVIFFSITGYYLSTSRFKAKRLVSTWIQTFLYSFACLVVGFIGWKVGWWPQLRTLLMGFNGTHTVELMLMPVISREYWFVSAYFLLLLLVPVLNVVITHVHRTYMQCLLYGLIVISLLPIIGLGSFQPYDSTVYAITCYLIGGYLRKYGEKINISPLKCTGGVLAAMVLFGMVHYAMAVPSPIAKYFGWNSLLNMSIRTPGLIIGTLIFASVLSNSHPWSRRTINIAATGMFGVYLIHENWLGARILWYVVNELVPIPRRTIAKILIGAVLVTIIFVILTAISLIFDFLIVHPVQHLVSKIWKHMKQHFANRHDRIRNQSALSVSSTL